MRSEYYTMEIGRVPTYFVIFVIFVILNYPSYVFSSNVVELDGRIISMKDDSPWLIEFFAPWCGHCKKLESVYEKVAKELRETGSPISVGRVDGTRLPEVMSHFSVHGYPTIKYVYGKEELTHRGDRSKVDIINFAKRAHGPPVREVNSIGRYNEVMDEMNGQVYFMLVNDESAIPEQEYRLVYQLVAGRLRTLSYFLAGPARVIKSPPAHIEQLLVDVPALLVFKDGSAYRYPNKLVLANNDSIASWVASERLEHFPKTTEGQLYDLHDLGKKVVLFVVNGSEHLPQQQASIRDRFLHLGKTLAAERRDVWAPHFQFLQLHDPSVAASLSLSWRLDTPNLLVMDLGSRMFWMLDNWSQESPAGTLTEQEFTQLLADILSGARTPYGGDRFIDRLKRAGFDLVTGFADFITVSPVLALVVLGVPTGVVSLLVYAICCMDTSEEEPEEEEEEEAPPLIQAVEGDKSSREKKDD